MLLEALKLLALPVVVGGALVGADVSALSSAYAQEFTQVGQYGVGEDSAAEIIASDGQVLAYTNSDKGSVDFVNISKPF